MHDFQFPWVRWNLTGTLVMVGLAATAQAQTTTGTWSLYPEQVSTYRVTVQEPIDTDGSSVFNSNRGVVPIKFAVESALGPALLPSILTDTDADNDFGIASFAVTSNLTFADLTTLDVQGAFLEGGNFGGSIRWQVRIDMNDDGLSGAGDANLFIYYGTFPNFVGGAASGNLVGAVDMRFDTSQLGGTFYDSYAGAVQKAGSHRVLKASVIVDGGWGPGDQLYSLTSATVNDNSFSPEPPGFFEPVLDFPEATIEVEKISGSNAGAVNEVVSIQNADNNGVYRVVDHRYMYNLDVQALLGAGVYRVYVVIDGVRADGYAQFELK